MTKRKEKVMYGVEITSVGTTYNFVLDSRTKVQELVNNSFRVTKVRIWDETHNQRELSEQEVLNLLFGKELVSS
jgi:hypothetical protein